jgi:D-hydroxyproline dehydrogenase subunit gamma
VTAVRLHAAARLVEVTVDGEPMRLPLGEPLAAALACAGLTLLRRSPRDGAPRGAFCFMGACQECAVFVDGRLRQACMTPVTPGLAIERRGAP